jgi:hypothetical protein
MTPVVQCGFAGLSVVLLSIIVWLIKCLIAAKTELVAIQKEASSVNAALREVIKDNSTAIRESNGTARETKDLMIAIKDQLLSRPCLMKDRP